MIYQDLSVAIKEEMDLGTESWGTATACVVLEIQLHRRNQSDVRACIQKFPDWPPVARTANGTALCH
jgi:hypothetical protein